MRSNGPCLGMMVMDAIVRRNMVDCRTSKKKMSQTERQECAGKRAKAKKKIGLKSTGWD